MLKIKILVFSNLIKHISSFDFYKSTILTVLIFIVMYWGFNYGSFIDAFSVVLGFSLGFFPNIEGPKKHLLIGMLFSLGLGVVYITICVYAHSLPDLFYIPIVGILIFCTAMLASFGFRGSLLSFSGMYAVIMSYVIVNFDLSLANVLTNIILGGFIYIAVTLIAQYFFQNRNVSLLLAETIELTADFLSYNENLLWDNTENVNQKQILAIQVLINDKHELLRSILLNKRRRLEVSSKNQKQFLLFSELVNIFELAMANNFNENGLLEHLGSNKNIIKPIHEFNEAYINRLRLFAKAVRFNKKFLFDFSFENHLSEMRFVITKYTKDIGIIKARDTALKMHNALDLEYKQLEKLKFLDKIYNNILESAKIDNENTTLFLSPHTYNLKTLKSHLNFNSSIFKHSLRLTTAVIIGLFIGRWIDSKQAHWILLTITLILRPNFGLTKSRAINRIIGTLIGAILAVGIVLVTTNSIIYSVCVILAMIIGFSNVQNNYRVASAGITLSIILLYVFNAQNAVDVILLRVAFTILGCFIAFMAMYTLWPTWENKNFDNALEEAIESNKLYFEIISNIYQSKNDYDANYKLIRMNNLLKSSNLNAAFQRMTEEPDSKQENISNYYVAVLINNTFLSAVASLSSYIQYHKTTSASENFKIISNTIIKNLEICMAYLKEKNIIEVKSDHDLNLAFKSLENVYENLIIERNNEIQAGKLVFSVEMKAKLQEGKMIIDQLKWLVNITKNLLETIDVIKSKGNLTTTSTRSTTT